MGLPGGFEMPYFDRRDASRRLVYSRPFRHQLAAKGFRVLDSFSCRGLHTIGLLRLVGGINKGRPNDRDLDRAVAFAARLCERVARPETAS